MNHQQLIDKCHFILSKKLHRCLHAGVEFSVPLLEVLEMAKSGKDSYTGQPIDTLNSTFERINPKLGYISGNVCLISKEANTHKSLLDAFVKKDVIPNEMKIKLMRKAIYALEKEMRNEGSSSVPK